MSYNHLIPGHPDNPKRFAICGAVRIGRGVCTMRAGWGTRHVGLGRCKWHGGSSLSGPDHPSWKGGSLRTIFQQRLKEAYNITEGRRANLLDLSDELQALRTLAAMALDKMLGGDGLLNDLTAQDDEVIELMMVGGGGVVIDGGSKVSSSLARARSEMNPEKYEAIKRGCGGDEGIAGRVYWELYGEMRPPEYEEMMVVMRHIEGVVKTVSAIEAIRANDMATRAEHQFFISVVKEEMREVIGDGEEYDRFIRRLRDRLPGVAG